MYRIPYY